MVTAALKFCSDATSSATSYTTADSARLDILKTLNWYEAHDEYEWPDFSSMGFDFSQAMRFRRALVSDVFVALQKAGNVRVSGEVGVFGTPESVRGRGVKRSGVVIGGKFSGGGFVEEWVLMRIGGRRLAERKRRCQLGDESDTEAASDDEKSVWNDNKFLAETMRRLMHRASVYDDHLAKKDTKVLADIVHDGLIEGWQGPQGPDGEASTILKEVAETEAYERKPTVNARAQSLM